MNVFDSTLQRTHTHRANDTPVQGEAPCNNCAKELKDILDRGADFVHGPCSLWTRLCVCAYVTNSK